MPVLLAAFWVWGRVWLVVRLQEAVFLTEMEMAVVAVNPPEVIVVQEWAAPVNNRSEIKGTGW